MMSRKDRTHRPGKSTREANLVEGGERGGGVTLSQTYVFFDSLHRTLTKFKLFYTAREVFEYISI